MYYTLLFLLTPLELLTQYGEGLRDNVPNSPRSYWKGKRLRGIAYTAPLSTEHSTTSGSALRHLLFCVAKQGWIPVSASVLGQKNINLV